MSFYHINDNLWKASREEIKGVFRNAKPRPVYSWQTGNYQLIQSLLGILKKNISPKDDDVLWASIMSFIELTPKCKQTGSSFSRIYPLKEHILVIQIIDDIVLHLKDDSIWEEKTSERLGENDNIVLARKACTRKCKDVLIHSSLFQSASDFLYLISNNDMDFISNEIIDSFSFDLSAEDAQEFRDFTSGTTCDMVRKRHISLMKESYGEFLRLHIPVDEWKEGVFYDIMVGKQ